MKPLALTIGLCGLSAIAAGSAVNASNGFDDRVISVMAVNVDDLDLRTQDGLQQLDRRIDRAVRHVCRVVDVKTGLLRMDRDGRACMAQARAGANRQMAALIEGDGRGG